MIPLPKPRGFWDYALFTLAMTGLLLFFFWFEASGGVGWADGALAASAATLLVSAIVLGRRGEKAKWITQQTWPALAIGAYGVFVWMFGAIYADAYLLHRSDITSNRIRHDVVLAIVLPGAMLWSLRRRFRAKRQVL
jgi:peptidoglycan/LPS O-acetylase OafA/YrhL